MGIDIAIVQEGETDLHFIKAVLKDGELSEVTERLEALEEKVDELLDLARSTGLVASSPVEYDRWADPYAGGGGL